MYRCMASLIVVFLFVIALTLTLCMAFVSYIMGWWGVWTDYMRAPRFCISIASINESLVLEIYVVNRGDAAVKVLRVVVDGGVYRFVNDTVWVVKPRESKWVTISGWKVKYRERDPVPGDVVRVYIYTEQWGQVFYDVVIGGG